MAACPGCGAVYTSEDDDCARRFDALLALDHSRAEPWGSRHALAFSAFAMQHPDRFGRDVLERSWLVLYSAFVKNIPAERVTRGLRRLGKRLPDWDVPAIPDAPPPRFSVTIRDLGSFDTQMYPAQLEAWCRSALDGWRALESR